ncbi:hypothetical protein [Nostoc sp. NOS(2021)]|uniref:hypothetical protein n=1 Tax=Nostoc sp. NOS(2021) TaxID=2815407 RepID=UPI0025E7B602|nr:hypothetical protein [Nostoc sp. NOS(2021)]
MIKPIYKQTFNPVPSPQSPVPCYTSEQAPRLLLGGWGWGSCTSLKPEPLYIAASSANGTQQTIYSASLWNEVEGRGAQRCIKHTAI